MILRESLGILSQVSKIRRVLRISGIAGIHRLNSNMQSAGLLSLKNRRLAGSTAPDAMLNALRDRPITRQARPSPKRHLFPLGMDRTWHTAKVAPTLEAKTSLRVSEKNNCISCYPASRSAAGESVRSSHITRVFTKSQQQLRTMIDRMYKPQRPGVAGRVGLIQEAMSRATQIPYGGIAKRVFSVSD